MRSTRSLWLWLVLAMFVLVLFFSWPARRSPAAGSSLTLFCAAGLQPAVDAVLASYREECGVEVRVQYGGSGTLLSSLRVTPAADLYLAADHSYMEQARSHGLLAEQLDLATQRPVLAVPAGNPRSVGSVADLTREDLTVALANPDAAAIGRVTRTLLEKTGRWPAVREHCKVMKPTVNDLANDLKIGTADVAVVWSSTAAQYPGVLEAVSDPLLDSAEKTVSIGVVVGSENSATALQLARYLRARDRGQPILEQHGFDRLDGDPFEPEPELVLYCGAMLHPAVDPVIQKFERREGVQVERVYNGCGILVSQMLAGAVPDAYFSCDVTFLDAVGDRFEEGLLVSENPVVLLVAKGNPHALQGLADLLRPELRVGLAHPDKSALGALTLRLLERHDLRQALEQSGNQKLDSATGDFLVNQLRTGSLDAVVVYASNAAHVGEHLDVVPLADPDALALQPYAVARDTRFPDLAARLRDALTNRASRESFEELGFGWRLEGPGQ